MSIGLRPGNRIAPTAEPPSIVRGLLRFIVSRLRCIKGSRICQAVHHFNSEGEYRRGRTLGAGLCRTVVDPTSDLIFRLLGNVLI